MSFRLTPPGLFLAAGGACACRAAIPAPQHRSAFPNVTAPRDMPSWNLSAPDHHWLVSQQPPTREAEVVAGDEHFRNRALPTALFLVVFIELMN